MQFNLTIDMDNDIFKGDPGGELRRILRVVAKLATDTDGEFPDYFPHIIRDINGNKIGQWEINDDE